MIARILALCMVLLAARQVYAATPGSCAPLGTLTERAIQDGTIGGGSGGFAVFSNQDTAITTTRAYSYVNSDNAATSGTITLRTSPLPITCTWTYICGMSNGSLAANEPVDYCIEDQTGGTRACVTQAGGTAANCATISEPMTAGDKFTVSMVCAGADCPANTQNPFRMTAFCTAD